MVGARGEDHVGKLGRREADADRRAQAALGRLRRAGLDEAPEPLAVDLRPALGRRERLEVEIGRLALGVGRHVRECLVERPRAVSRVEHRQHVAHGGEDRHPGAPAGGAVGGAEQRGALEQRRGLAQLVQPDHGLRQHEPDVLLEPLLQLAHPVRAPVALGRRRVEPHVAVAHLGVEGGDVVGEGIEGAAAGEIEARVVPVAGEDAVAHRAAAEREAHVRAAVVERVHAALVDEEHDRPVAGGHDLRLIALELGERADAGRGRAVGAVGRGHRAAPFARWAWRRPYDFERARSQGDGCG